MNEVFDVTVLREDYENSSKDYQDKKNCPLATALKRISGIDDVYVLTSILWINGEEYRLDRAFEACHYNDLRHKGIEFQTIAKRN